MGNFKWENASREIPPPTSWVEEVVPQSVGFSNDIVKLSSCDRFLMSSGVLVVFSFDRV